MYSIPNRNIHTYKVNFGCVCVILSDKYTHIATVVHVAPYIPQGRIDLSDKLTYIANVVH
jgi:hypothetical protein